MMLKTIIIIMLWIPIISIQGQGVQELTTLTYNLYHAELEKEKQRQYRQSHKIYKEKVHAIEYYKNDTNRDTTISVTNYTYAPNGKYLIIHVVSERRELFSNWKYSEGKREETSVHTSNWKGKLMPNQVSQGKFKTYIKYDDTGNPKLLVEKIQVKLLDGPWKSPEVTKRKYTYDGGGNLIKSYLKSAISRKYQLISENKKFGDSIIKFQYDKNGKEYTDGKRYLTFIDTVNNVFLIKKLNANNETLAKKVTYFNKQKEVIGTEEIDLEKGTSTYYKHRLDKFGNVLETLKSATGLENSYKLDKKYSYEYYNDKGLIRVRVTPFARTEYSYEFYE